MKILEELYFGNISESTRKRNYDKKTIQKEMELYDSIKELLGDNGSILDEFIDVKNISIDKDILEAYINGFKTGALIVLELRDVEL